MSWVVARPCDFLAEARDVDTRRFRISLRDSLLYSGDDRNWVKRLLSLWTDVSKQKGFIRMAYSFVMFSGTDHLI